jgi:hypothetical protein
MDSKTALKGFFRINIEDQDGTISGDSGWVENNITNLGFQYYIVERMLASANSLRVGAIALGSGGAPADADLSLDGEHQARATLGPANMSVVGSKTAQFVATFNSGLSFVTDTATLSNIGLFAYTSANSGQIFAGNNYSQSQVATNQNVNVTYQIRFATT